VKNKFEIIWPHSALIDLDVITDYLLLSAGHRRAYKAYIKIKKGVESLEQYPLRCRPIPELQIHGIFDYRDLVIAPYRICFKIENQKVILTAILDGRRDIEYILLDRIMRI
jgi:toxin ParE1/3/4